MVRMAHWRRDTVTIPKKTRVKHEKEDSVRQMNKSRKATDVNSTVRNGRLRRQHSTPVKRHVDSKEEASTSAAGWGRAADWAAARRDASVCRQVNSSIALIVFSNDGSNSAQRSPVRPPSVVR